MILICQVNNEEEIDEMKTVCQVFVITERMKQLAIPA